MTTKKGIFGVFNGALEILESVSAISWAADLLKGAKTGLDVAVPGFMSEVRRFAKKTIDGPLDETQFIGTLMLLDDETDPNRPLLKNVDSFVGWLVEHHPEEAIIFVYVVGLVMDDDQRLRFLRLIAEMMDENGDGRTNAVHERRYEMIRKYDAFRKPKNIVQKVLQKYPNQVESIKAAIANVPTGIAQDLRESGLQQSIEDFSQFGWGRVAARRAARAARNEGGGTN